MRNWILGAIALAAAVFLWRSLGSSEPAEPEPAETSAAKADEASTSATTRRPDRPTLESNTDAPRRGDTPLRTYRTHRTDDGRVVRDHRKNAAAAPSRPPLRAAMSKRNAVERATIGRIRLAVRPAVKSCVADADADLAKGTRLQVVLYTDIKDGVATASGLEITGDAPAEIEECVRAKMTAVKVDVPEATDVEGYPFNFPFDLARLR